MATTNSREARRRKIMERGSDRLALITGRIQDIPSPPSGSDPNPSSHPEEQQSQPGVSHDLDQSTVSHWSQSKASKATMQEKNSVDDALAMLQKIPATDEASVVPAFEATDEPATLLPSSLDQRSSNPSALPPTSELSNEPLTSIPSSLDQGSSHPSLGSEQTLVRRIYPGISCSPNQISNAITSSARIRLICSVMIGLLVVLSYVGFPLLRNKIIRNILTFRPFFLVLLTNVTVVLARLISNEQSSSMATGVENTTTDGNPADQVGLTLERGFLLMNAMDAAVVDFSFYAVVVVCGLSFVQKLI